MNLDFLRTNIGNNGITNAAKWRAFDIKKTRDGKTIITVRLG